MGGTQDGFASPHLPLCPALCWVSCPTRAGGARLSDYFQPRPFCYFAALPRSNALTPLTACPILCGRIFTAPEAYDVMLNNAQHVGGMSGGPQLPRTRVLGSWHRASGGGIMLVVERVNLLESSSGRKEQ